MRALETTAVIAGIIESLFVVVSVILIVIQLRKQTELARAANSQSMFELSSPFNLELVRDRDFARLWLQGPNADPIDVFRHESLITWWLLLHENIYFQWKRGLLADEAYLPWDRDLLDFIRHTNAHRIWPRIRGFYQGGFASRIDNALADGEVFTAEATPNPGPEPDDTAGAAPRG
jgi:hypothetical protein